MITVPESMMAPPAENVVEDTARFVLATIIPVMARPYKEGPSAMVEKGVYLMESETLALPKVR